eukprot:Gregarina_sp_Poly_1__10138@NODE_693_length_6728_cov_41_128809_g523_i0_p3_GENE_NODE_693_length_6728_cov_41_128809_g523_i0NODE_693_length_6728_cov_41_128809_g523_i0_p3_ORF_typecomplete_len284_score29_68_NODE_693_length_6728_cov_41_128809_g523_i028773728
MKLFQVQGFKLLVPPSTVREKLLRLLPVELRSDISERIAVLLTPPVTDTPSTRATMASTSHMESLPTSLKLAHTTPARARSPRPGAVTGHMASGDDPMKRRRLQYDDEVPEATSAEFCQHHFGRTGLGACCQSSTAEEQDVEDDNETDADMAINAESSSSDLPNPHLHNSRHKPTRNVWQQQQPGDETSTSDINGFHTAPPRCFTTGEDAGTFRGTLDQCSEVSDGTSELTANTLIAAHLVHNRTNACAAINWDTTLPCRPRRRLSCDEAMMDSDVYHQRWEH